MEAADKRELLEVLDENGKGTNTLEQRSVIHKKGLFHNEVSCIVINNQKQILLQKRSKNKKIISKLLGFICRPCGWV